MVDTKDKGSGSVLPIVLCNSDFISCSNFFLWPNFSCISFMSSQVNAKRAGPSIASPKKKKKTVNIKAPAKNWQHYVDVRDERKATMT